MFTLQDMKTAHARVKTGADFPRYVAEIKSLGLIHYDFMVKDGSFVYYGAGGHRVVREGSLEPLPIARKASVEVFRHVLSIHQQGQTDFPTFRRQAAESGVEKWAIDTVRMVCTYLDVGGLVIVEEAIPTTEAPAAAGH